MAMRRWILSIWIVLLMLPAAYGDSPSLELTREERQWLAQNSGRVLHMGLDPYAGMEYFEYQGQEAGYLPELAAVIEEALGLPVVMVTDRSWGQVFDDLQQGRIDILAGANETPERRKTMAFTRPVLQYPYAVFSRRDSGIQTLGDLDGKRLGFIEGDFVLEKFPETYAHIDYAPVIFKDQQAGMTGLLEHAVDGFITSGGGVKYDILYRYPAVALVGEISTIRSDMTLSVNRRDAVLAGILDKVIAESRATALPAMVHRAEQAYNRKIMQLTPEEIRWLDQEGTAVVGLADDYLPFDYYVDNEYKGISGAVLNRVREITGIRFTVRKGSFDDLYHQAVAGEVDILNLALTEDRLAHFIYPRPISMERDIIIGRQHSDPVFDVYGLEGKRVAVIEGFWHEEYLKKNLRDPHILITRDIRESLNLLRSGGADYVIENPTVAEYYINGLGYTDLVKKGTTSKDSFVYLGVTRKNPELAAILDKALVFINYDEMKYLGIQSVPQIENARNQQLGRVILILVLVLTGVGFVMTHNIRQLIRQRSETQILKEREHLLHTDVLTGLYNRTYFNAVEESLSGGGYPQTVLITDLNMLKATNDTYGHHVGDQLISAYGAVLREGLPGAMLFRMGGDEFMAILPDTDSVSAEACIRNLKDRCRAVSLAVSEHTRLPVSAAFGYAVRTGPGEDLAAAIIRADNHMYQDKRQREAIPERESNHGLIDF